MTIKDLSAQTGYSVGTVSRVLNHQPNVSEKARKAILEAAEKSGFQLNTNAQELKLQRTNNILVVVKGSSNQLFGNLVEAIQSRMADTPYHLVVDYMDEDDNEVLRAIRLCREKKPAGIIFLSGDEQHFLADFNRIDTPSVLVTNDASKMPFANLSSVTTDNALAAKSAIDKLIAAGHRDIAVIGGRLDSDTVRLRYDGCMAAFREHGITFNPERDYVAVRFSYAGGYQAAEYLLRNWRKYTAIFAMADVMAMGAIRALSDNGVKVPEDVSVMGYDGLPIGQFTVPRLATVSQGVEELAQRSVTLLRRSIEHKATASHETVPSRIQWRESAREV